MREFMLSWFSVLNVLNANLVYPINELSDGLGIPVLSALLFGLLGATAPCQLTTNAGALAYVARNAGNRRAIARDTLAYLLAKVLIYTLIGALAILAGRQFSDGMVPLIVAVRKLLGPLMILIGLYLLGLTPLRFSVGERLSAWVRERAGTGPGGAFVLGTSFSLAFCPTLFLLFFGITIPLALTSSAGLIYPGVFAVGTTAPLFGLTVLLVAGVGATTGYLRGARQINRWLKPAAAIVFLLAGLNDTLVYWFL